MSAVLPARGSAPRLFRVAPLVALVGFVSLIGLLPVPVAASPRVDVATVAGSINPASADYLIESIAASERSGAAALLIELDTPGGLVSSTKDIIQAILNAEIPVIVYVSPRGAWAASAGTYITVAAHIAVMAPSTSIGAAHPVGVGGGGEMPASPAKDGDDEDGAGSAARNLSMEKAENLLAAYMETIARERERNVAWVVKAVRESVAIGEEEALELGVIDLVAEDRAALFEAIQGREVKVAGELVTLDVAGASFVALEMTLLQQIFNFLADPNLAVVLLMAGLLGIYVEVNNPGLIVPGVAGGVCLILTGIAFQILPFSWVGLILIFAGLALFVAEIFVTSFGALFGAGAICFLLGGTMVFDQPDLSDLTVSFWTVLLPTVVGMCIFAGVIVFSVGRSMRLAETAGVDEMIGLVGRAASRIDPRGKIFVRGEYWNVDASDGMKSVGAGQAAADGAVEAAIEEGEAVEIVGVDGLTLRVRRAGS